MLTSVWEAGVDVGEPSRWPCWKGHSVIKALPIRSQKPHRVLGCYFFELRFDIGLFTPERASPLLLHNLYVTVSISIWSDGRVSIALTNLPTFLSACDDAWNVPAWTLLILILTYQMVLTCDIASITMQPSITHIRANLIDAAAVFHAGSEESERKMPVKILHQMSNVNKKMVETVTFSLALQNPSV